MKVRFQALKFASVMTLLAGLVAALGKLSHRALATPALNFNSVVLARSFFEKILIPARGSDDDAQAADPFKVRIDVKDPSDVYVVDTVVPLGGNSGWHTHPGPSIVSVKSGTATIYDGNDPSCTPVTYPAGTGFVDAGGGHVHLVRNAGSVNLELVAFQVIPAGASRRIDAPDPGFCPGL